MKFVVCVPPENEKITVEAGHVLVQPSGALLFSDDSQMKLVLAFAPGSWSSCHDCALTHCWERVG